MEHVRIRDIENSAGPWTIKRRLTGPLGLSNHAINYYELAPGDSFAFAYHRHVTEEEVFLVLEGRVEFDTEDGTVAVAAGEAVRLGPGEFQRGWNRGDERVVAMALGAPLVSEENTRLVDCPDCGEPTHNDIERPDDRTATTVCAECGAETARYRVGDDGESGFRSG